MGLLESALLSVCVGTSGMSNQACTNAINAGGKQTGVFDVANKYEDHRLHNLEQGAVSFLGKNTTDAVGGMAWLVKSIADKRAMVGLTSHIAIQVGQDKNLLILKWTF